MSRGSLAVLGLVVAVAMPGARAAPPAIAQAEISYLLGYIGSSDCEFYRNGAWNASARAQAHLRYKYEALAAADRILTADDFIDKAASRSSVSGGPYEVRCGKEKPETTSEWLRAALTRCRAVTVHGASGVVQRDRLSNIRWRYSANQCRKPPFSHSSPILSPSRRSGRINRREADSVARLCHPLERNQTPGVGLVLQAIQGQGEQRRDMAIRGQRVPGGFKCSDFR